MRPKNGVNNSKRVGSANMLGSMVCEMLERCNSSRYKCWLLVSVLVLFLFYCSLTQHSRPPNSLLSPSQIFDYKKQQNTIFTTSTGNVRQKQAKKNKALIERREIAQKNNVIIEVKTQSNVVMSFFSRHSLQSL